MVRDEDIVNLVVDRFTHGERTFSGLFDKMGGWYHRFRGWRKSAVDSHRNQLVINVALSLIEVDVSRKVGLTASGWPICQFVGFDPANPEPARNVETIVSAQMEDAGLFEKIYDFYLAADIMGTGVLRTGWKNQTQKMKYRYINPITEQEEISVEDATLFDGPDIEFVDPRDSIPQPSARRWKDAKWHTHRYWIDIDDVLLGEQTKLYLKGSHQKVKETTAVPVPDDQWRWRPWSEFSKEAEPNTTQVEIIEYDGLVPDELVKDGIKLRTIIVANRRVLLSDDGFPFWHGSIQKKFPRFCPMPDPFQMHGISKMEIVDKAQAAINKIASLKLDILELVASPVTLFNKDAGVNLQNLQLKPGAMIGINGPVDDTQFRPLMFNLSGLQALYPETNFLNQSMEQSLGIAEDVVSGMQGSDRQTAREAMIRHEEVLKRLALEAKLAEKVVIEPVAETFRDLDKQYLTLPHQRNILGSRAEINPITGLPKPQEPTILTLGDLRQDYNARAVGSSMFISRTQRRTDGIALMQAMQANPVAVQAVNWTNFFRQLFELFDFGSPDEMLVQNVPAINQLAGANEGQIPQNPAQASNLPPLDPNQIGEQQQMAMFGGGGGNAQ